MRLLRDYILNFNLNDSIVQIPGDTGFTEPLPVMIFFYGGGSYYGASYGYGGKYFMDEDVVLVIVNYRLTAFGTINTI